MYTYLADAAVLQPSRHSFGLTLVNWIKGRLAARRARIAERKAIVYLRKLDRHALDDIGVDVAALCGVVPRLASINPYVVAMSAIIPTQSR
jgi:hypothetical protein